MGHFRGREFSVRDVVLLLLFSMQRTAGQLRQVLTASTALRGTNAGIIGRSQLRSEYALQFCNPALRTIADGAYCRVVQEFTFTPSGEGAQVARGW